MNKASIGSKISIDKSAKTFKLENPNQSIRFRFISTDYLYDGKHIMQVNGKWEVTDCKRINKSESCEYCSKFFDAKKDLKENAEDELAKADVKKYQPKITFYYLILNRDEQAVQVLETTLMVRLAIDEKQQLLERLKADIKNYDFILTRTEKPGRYYELTQVDSSLSEELSEEEVELLQSNLDISNYMPTQNVSSNDLPF